jgi:uncharacterized DUF497 family protein
MYNAVRFEWDDAKNRAKDGVDFEPAVQVFADPFHVLIKDRIDEEGEQRSNAVGLSDDLPLFVVHVYRSFTDGKEEIIRIISARKASERESRRYFGQTAE